ncbi:Zn-dependent hydrolase [Paenibacillus sp. J31TS4]|uniref:MBL fold metallo-hydrolase n=1 Tax=Paenibacillus sp. J31TS4 TaxID=2807195 RepID=UPI001B122643|nr:MBL fold metallo-hydrolase [Paenibacillus sp. J31TS4]GIP41414.1 Zn-dependent hydrolase [Paenibacillus sp. J31TS4]
MLLKYFYHEKLAQASYLVGCQACGTAIVIDPLRDPAPYRKTAQDNGLTIVAAAETHIHADFVSGIREFAQQDGMTVYLSGEGGELGRYEDAEKIGARLLKDGDSFQIGNIRFQALHTPGHTPEHMAFLLTDRAAADEPMGLFSGDFVFAGDVGRPDLLEKATGRADTAKLGARQMFQSLQRFRTLPDYLQVWPGHGAGSACGKALGAIPSTTVGYEKRFNPALAYESEEEFLAFLLEGQPEPPNYFAQMKRVNQEGPALLSSLKTPERLEGTQREVEEALEQDATILDLRPSARFAEGHVPGTINLPYNKSFLTWAGWLLTEAKPLYVIAADERLDEVLADLRMIGIDRTAGVFGPELLSRYEVEGGRLQSYGQVKPEEAASRLEKGEVLLIDVRNAEEWKNGHIPGAKHLPLGRLPARLGELDPGQPIVVQCQSGSRSAIAASVLQAAGFADVSNLTGGFAGWQRAGLPEQKGD